MNINYEDFEDDDTPAREKIHRNREPVNGRHDMQRRAENGKNRAIKTQRRQKERERDS